MERWDKKISGQLFASFCLLVVLQTIAAASTIKGTVKNNIALRSQMARCT